MSVIPEALGMTGLIELIDTLVEVCDIFITFIYTF